MEHRENQEEGEVLPVNQWEDFENIVRRLAVWREKRYFFRGQPRDGKNRDREDKRKLQPTLARKLEKLEVTDCIRARDIEWNAIDNFMSHAHRYLNQTELPQMRVPPQLAPLPEDQELSPEQEKQRAAYEGQRAQIFIQWWMLMQQYGAPTRLLDWSMSPYLGLYFAVNDNFGEDGTVWFFDHLAFVEGVKVVHPPKQGSTSFRHVIHEFDHPNEIGEFPHMHCIFPQDGTIERLFKQQGGFTVCGDLYRDHGNVIIAIEKRANEKSRAKIEIGLTKLVIKADRKPEFLRRLGAMNIQGASLYTGIQALATYVGDIVAVGGCASPPPPAIAGT